MFTFARSDSDKVTELVEIFPPVPEPYQMICLFEALPL